MTLLWLSALCRPDPGYGGWCHVRRAADGTLTGAAGGERRVGGARMALTALSEGLSALADPPAAAPLTLRLADAALLAELRAGAADGPMAQAEPELWKTVVARLAARPGTVLEPLPASAPAAGFLAAWAAFGLDTAKTRGTFKAAIPKPNLLKFPG